LNVCKINSSNILAWQLLTEVIIKFLLAFNKSQISKTFTLLINSIEKEFKNPAAKNIILEIIVLFIRDNETRIQFLNYWLSKALVRLPQLEPNLYLINIPIKISNLVVYENKCTVDFNLIFFRIDTDKDEFSMGDTNINYDLEELCNIFIEAIKGEEAIMCINLSYRKVLVYSSDNYRIPEFRYLISLYKEFTNMNLNPEINKLNTEIKKVEPLVQIIQDSDVDQNKIDTYRRGLKLLKDSQSKAIKMKQEYFQFLKERTLNFYLEDLEAYILKIENQKINWQVKHKQFKEDYDSFKSMIKEYKKLNLNAIVIENKQKAVTRNIVKTEAQTEAEPNYPYARSHQDVVALIDDYVIINKGILFQFLNFFDTDANTVKIPVETITTLNYKPSGILDGYLEFVYLGFIPRANDTIKHAQENVITFRGEEQNNQFFVFKEIVEKRARELRRKEIPSSSSSLFIAEELNKLGELKQKGLINQEEFDARKKKLLDS
jgi:hypothetical protein